MLNYHEAKNELDRAVLAGEITLSAIALAIFRFLLSHTFYTEDSYGYVRIDRCGTAALVALTGYSESAVKRAIRELKAARLIHGQPRPNWNGGRQVDEYAIIWPGFHDEDGAEGVTENPSGAIEGAKMALSDRAEGAALSTEGVCETAEGVTENPSFLSKNLRTAAVEEAAAKGSSRAKAITRSASARAKDNHPALEEYVSDLEGVVDTLEARLGMAPGTVDVKLLAKLWSDMMFRHGRTYGIASVVEGLPADDELWARCAGARRPVGYFLGEFEREYMHEDDSE